MMSVADEYWAYFQAQLDAEAEAIEKARRLRGLRVREASLVGKGACPGAVVTFYKKAEPMHDKDAVYEAMQKRAAELGDPWPASDPTWCELYRTYLQLPDPEPEPVAKADEGDTPAWKAIRKAAGRLVEAAGGAITFAEAVEQTVYARPQLYDAYCRELAGLEE